MITHRPYFTRRRDPETGHIHGRLRSGVGPCRDCAIGFNFALHDPDGAAVALRFAIGRLLDVHGDASADRLAHLLRGQGFAVLGADDDRVAVLANGDPHLVVCSGWSELAAQALILAVREDGCRVYPDVTLSYEGGRAHELLPAARSPKPGRPRTPHHLYVTIWGPRAARGIFPENAS